MRFQIEGKGLRQIVAVAGLPIKRSTSPILECVRLAALDNRIVAHGTNLDMSTQAVHEAAVSNAGECSVNFADLRAIASRLKGLVTCELQSSGFAISCHGASLVLPVLSGEIPNTEKPSDETEIDGGIDAMAACVPFAATEDVKWHLRGVIFGDGHAVGTNGERFYATPCSGGAGQIVPSEAAPLIAKIGGRLFLSDKTWRVESEGATAVGKLVDAQPIPWKRITFNNEPFAKLEADDLISAIDMATVGRASWVVASAGEGVLSISGDRFTGLHIDSKCDVRCDGDPQSFVMSTSICLTAVKPFTGRAINLSTNGKLIMARAEGGDDFALMGAMHDPRSTLREAA